MCFLSSGVRSLVARSLLLGLLDLLEESAVLSNGHVAGATRSALASIRGRGRLRGSRFLASGLLASLLGTRDDSINSSSALAGGLSGLLGNLLSALCLDGRGGTSLLRFAATERDDLGVALLDLPFANGVGEDSLADLALTASDGGHIGLASSCGSDDLAVAKSLNGGLELVVTVKVGWVASGVERLLELGLEGVDDEAALNSGVRGEDLGGVDAAELQRPRKLCSASLSSSRR